jgi:5-methylcytosine-specific restriction endonuclease McrA
MKVSYFFTIHRLKMSMDYEYNFVDDNVMAIDNKENDDDCIIVGVTSISQKPLAETKYKKKYISSTLKRLVWNKWIGEEVGKAKCCCCNTTDIVQMSFHAGHIIAEINGGKTAISNLMPICQNCNSSMGRMNLYDFMATLK